MTKSIKFLLFLLVAGLVSVVSCKKSDPESQAKLFSAPANCFMVSEPGFYSFNAFKGKTTESVGAVAKAEVLWESFGTHDQPNVGDIIAEAYYENGLIYFKTPSALKDGNAVIAAKDASGNILWSWHIWVCNGWDAAATAQKYYNKSNGIASFGAVMDRNLGATSATINDHKAHGLLYQWGRKDPFLGWDGYNANGHTPALSTITWPDPVKTSEETGTIEYAIAHPTTYLYPGKVSSNVDWYFTKEHNVTDNMRWNERLTLYDPCPAGWTLPEARTTNKQGLWYNALEHNWKVVYDYWDPTILGVNLGGKLGSADTIWYPEASLLYFEDGNLYRTRQVYIWSRNVAPNEDDGLPIFKVSEGGEGGFTPEVYTMDVTAYTMLCQKNAQDHTEAWAASHTYRAIALPTRCVALK